MNFDAFYKNCDVRFSKLSDQSMSVYYFLIRLPMVFKSWITFKIQLLEPVSDWIFGWSTFLVTISSPSMHLQHIAGIAKNNIIARCSKTNRQFINEFSYHSDDTELTYFCWNHHILQSSWNILQIFPMKICAILSFFTRSGQVWAHTTE